MKNKEVLIIQDEIVIFQEEHDLILEPGDQVRVLPVDEDFGVIDEPYPDEEYEDEFIDEPIIVEEPEIEDEYGVIKPAEGYVGDEPIVDEDDLYDGFDDYEVEEEDDEVLGDHHDVVNIDNVPVDIENDLYDLENSKIVVVHEDVRIKQDGHDIILEKGDRIEILKEASFGNVLIFPVKGCKPIPDKDYDELFSRSYNGPMINPYMKDEEAPKPWDATFSVEKNDLVVEGSAGAGGFGSCVVKVPLPRSMKDASYSFIIKPKSQEDFDWITQKLRSLLYELSYE